MSANLSELLGELKKRGVVLSALSRDIGLHPSALSPNKPLAVWHIEPLRRAVCKRGMILSSCGETETAPRDLLKKAHVRLPRAKRDPEQLRALGNALLDLAES